MSGCTSSIDKFKSANEKLNETSLPDPFGIGVIIRDVVQGILDKFIDASKELDKVEKVVEEQETIEDGKKS